MDFPLKTWLSTHLLLFVIIGIATIELQAAPIEPASHQAAAPEEVGELELSSEQRKELLDLVVKQLKSCKEGGESESEACKNDTLEICKITFDIKFKLLRNSKDWPGSGDLGAATRQFLVDMETLEKDFKKLTVKDWSRINAIVGNPKPFFFKTWPPETEVLMLFAIVLELDPKDWRGSSDLSAEARQFLVDSETLAKDAKKQTPEDIAKAEAFFAGVDAKFQKTMAGLMAEARSMLADG